MKNIHIATYHENSKKFAKDLPDFGIPVVVRLGGSREYAEYPIQVNSAESILNSVDKKSQKDLLIANGIKTLPLLDIGTFPCVIKGRVRSCGTSVVVCNTDIELQHAMKNITKNCNGYILEPLFYATSEYRLHCTQEEVFFAVKKIKNNPNEVIVNAKNHYNVREFVKPRKWEQIKAECVKAMKVLGLDIACFDVMYSSEGEHSFVIAEANTNPEMLNNTYAAYLPMLEKIIRAKMVDLPKPKVVKAKKDYDPVVEKNVALSPHVLLQAANKVINNQFEYDPKTNSIIIKL